MNVPILQLGLYLFGAAVLGASIIWLVYARAMKRALVDTEDHWQTRFDKAARHNGHLLAENATLHTSLEAERATLLKHKHAAAMSRTELESSREKTITLSKEVFVVGEERDELRNKLSRTQGVLVSAKQQLTEQQTDFAKGREFYKSQLESALEQRTTLERKVDDAKSEHESLRNLLMSAKSEHESVSNMLASAKTRLENLDQLEQKVISLEAENAQLRQDATLAKREAEALQRDVDELEALKLQNKELAHCLQSMENSRKQHESDARRYRNQYEQSEQESETLRFKLGDIEKNWVELQQKEEEVRDANNNNSATPAVGLQSPDGDIDDLTKIIGVGKVFAATLHNLGIYHFRQIAAFGPAELARVNAELKEFKGRIEHDDWIGQAKDLHFRKYGADAG